MIKIEMAEDITQEYLRCSSCLCSNEETKMFYLLIGKNLSQVISIKLCEKCLKMVEKNIKELKL